VELTAREPFVFYSTAHIIELTGPSARSLPELRAGIAEVTGSSIFHHTFGARNSAGKRPHAVLPFNGKA
jgi:hypothetical protein